MHACFPQNPQNPAKGRQQFGPIKLVVIQPTTFCNLDCSYCYLPNRQQKHKFSLDLLEPIFREVFSSSFLSDQFTIVWHAGEPLTMPISFYEAAIGKIQELSDQYNHRACRYSHSLQTNATLINHAWCSFIKKHKIKVGVSLDGPAFIHDVHRVTRKGLGTHAATMRGIEQLKKNHIDFSVISVLTEQSLSYPDELYHFFLSNGIYRVGFNVEEIEGNHQASSLNTQDADDKYFSFMKRFYSLTSQPGNRLKVREFDRLRRAICNPTKQATQATPLSILSFDYAGNFMTFSPELLSLDSVDYGKFILGNIRSESLNTIADNPKFQQINHDIQAGIHRCRQQCEYFSLCGGGAPANKYFENGSFNSTETMYCRYTQKILTDILLTDIEKQMGIRGAA
ncbi:GRRM system radical SAM/SPASM domain protein [Leptolyngbyaceae cyanobacterium CCMR0082]|uniref:GRRM system radical SAM/SPASM domain protein n=1 Tax=Adonisia turfae CCMR0082 TaxID=2304604 RepID=A0A6M0S0Q0_9CYAN|nr:cyclophane-forming radical SAM/SPASM peptide maturase GrrM/OscB [Adonisia turfae]MDV3349034.1 GRRM system radical SAM/SPASM domain protein [Leptothoe sp. LEGE 181152]NEZ62059.1 GRRM system radical SAM/SPASM domain protein [Adonisia turfae CCMR0082]